MICSYSASASTSDVQNVTEAKSTGEVFALRSSEPIWMKPCLERIDGLRALGVNWNSYGAQPVDQTSIETAKKLIRELSCNQLVTCPRVAASPDGNVALSWEWIECTRELDLEVLANEILFSYMDERQPSTDIEGATAEASEIESLLTQW